MKDFKEEFNKITKLIETETSLVFVRYGDGEVLLMDGDTVDTNTQAYTVDKWSSSGKNKLGDKLKESLNHVEQNWYYGIPCDCCNKSCKEKLLNIIKVPDNQITYANLWVNSNYQSFINWISDLKEEVVVIGNHNGINNKFPFKVSKYIPIQDDCVNYYEKNDIIFGDFIINETKEYNNKLFLISAGPLAEVIINILYEKNKNNRYIDVGSSLDIYVHNKITRPYMIKGGYYNLKECKY